MTDRKPRVVDIDDDPLVDWVSEPIFDFSTEVEALNMLQALGEEIRAAREHERHCMRYMTAAVRAARNVTEGDGKLVSKAAIIGNSGLARQTVFEMLDSE